MNSTEVTFRRGCTRLTVLNEKLRYKYEWAITTDIKGNNSGRDYKRKRESRDSEGK
jgi:hypothetical protein